jgi:hypothetical protein
LRTISKPSGPSISLITRLTSWRGLMVPDL